MATAVRAPRPAAPDRRPAALLPVGVARLVGYAALAVLGALEWKRMVAGVPAGDALLWVLVGVLLSAAVLLCDRVPARWSGAATVAVGALALPAAWLAAGLDLGLFRESRWPELGDGLVRGGEALANAKLPYDGPDPWPGRVMEATGALLVVASGLLAVWPRGRQRGYPMLALVGLLVLVAVPVVSLGGTQPVLLGLALAGALPIGAAADKEEPWFDYKAFAEGLGPENPVTFDWEHGDYGPISWKRTGAEVLRVATERPSYWKVETLDGFDGEGWREQPPSPAYLDVADVPQDYRNRPGWNDTMRVSIRRLRGADVIGPGTLMDVRDATRPIVAGPVPGSWVARSDLRRGDSYVADAYIPRPNPGDLAGAPPVMYGERTAELTLRVPIVAPTAGIPTSPVGRPPSYAEVTFAAFGDVLMPVAQAQYPQLGQVSDGREALAASPYGRTWALAERLRARADGSAYEYLLAVNRYLQRGFRYDERPAPVPPGVAPLEGFLFDTKAGYCQHFSGAMALLLRMGGVPARVATGFSPGGYSKSRKAWIVRDTDAHSWVEVWFEGIGWVAFDPTPSATPARSQIAAVQPAPEPDAPDDADEADDADDAGAGGGDTGGDSGVRGDLLQDPLRDASGEGAGGDGGVPGWLLALGGVLAAAGAAVGVLWLRARRRGPVLDPEESIAELQRALRRTGRAAPTGTTLLGLERRLNLSADAAGYVRALRAGRYAPAAPPPSGEQRRALRRDLADGLGPLGRLRVLWALPPRPFGH